MSNTNYTKTTISLPREFLKVLRKVVPKGKYSEFALEAMREKLAREKSWNILKAKGILRFSKKEPFYYPEKFFAELNKLEAEEIKILRKKK